MKQITINNPQHQQLATTSTLIKLCMQQYHSAAELKLVQQLLEEHQQAGIIVTLDNAEPQTYAEYHQKLLSRLEGK